MEISSRSTTARMKRKQNPRSQPPMACPVEACLGARRAVRIGPMLNRNADDQNANADERIEPRCPGVEDLTQAGDASQDEKTADAPPECALHGPCPRSKRVHAYVSLPPRGLLFSGIHTREPRANACSRIASPCMSLGVAQPRR